MHKRPMCPSRCGFLLRGLLLATVFYAVTTHPATAQVLYGSVIGTITDQSDAVVPDAAITLTNRETGVAKEAASDSQGRYSLPNILPGRYDLKVTGKGFRTHAQTDIEVSPNVVARVDVRMEVGQLSETV